VTAPPKVLKNKKAGGKATFKPTLWGRQHAWRVKSLQLVTMRSKNKLNVVAATTFSTFGAPSHLDFNFFSK